MEGLERETHRLEEVDGLERERLERRPPGDGERQPGGGRERREQAARPRRQEAATRGRRLQAFAIQVAARLPAESRLATLDGRWADLAQSALAAAVLACELLAELRRQPAEHRQPGGLFQDAAQLAGRTLVVAADDDRPGEFQAAGQHARAAGGRSRGGAPLASVDDEHERGVEGGRHVHRTRPLDALPTVQRGLDGHDDREVGVRRPCVVQFAGDGVADQPRVEDPRRPRRRPEEEPPEGRSAPRRTGRTARSSANAASSAPAARATAGPGSSPQTTRRGADMTGVFLSAGLRPQPAVGRRTADSGGPG